MTWVTKIKKLTPLPSVLSCTIYQYQGTGSAGLSIRVSAEECYKLFYNKVLI